MAICSPYLLRPLRTFRQACSDISASHPELIEGGAAMGARQEARDDMNSLAREEEQILRCLGAAVIMQWDDLPTDIQRELFEHAVSMGKLNHTAALKGQIARFLHKHKGEDREAAWITIPPRGVCSNRLELWPSR